METEKQINCSKCGKPLGVLKYDDTVLQIANAEFYDACRYSCVCGRSRQFKPRPIENNDISGLGGYSRELLINLGKNREN